MPLKILYVNNLVHVALDDCTCAKLKKIFSTYNFSKAVNPKKLAAAKTPTTSASLTFISLSFSYNAERARAKAAKQIREGQPHALLHIKNKVK